MNTPLPAAHTLIPWLRPRLDDARFLHVLGVLHMSAVLCQNHNVPAEPCLLAAILHDNAKCWTTDQLWDAVQDYSIPVPAESKEMPQLLHGPVGAHMARVELGIEDEIVLDAVRHHTTGRTKPSDTLVVLMAADFCEPTRGYPGAQDYRELMKRDLRGGLRRGLESKLAHMKRKNVPIHPGIYETLDFL
jgi:predicted HD superfamily hydrolase involved in NAD metabolism